MVTTVRVLEIKNFCFVFFILLIITYLCVGTGLHSDDYDHLIRWATFDIKKILPFISHLPLIVYDSIVFFFLRENLILYDFVKIFDIALCFFFASKFMSDYTTPKNAAIFSFLFIFYPTHDSTVYWFVGQYIYIGQSRYLL